MSKNIILVKHQNTYQIIIGLFLISITKKMKIIILKSYITRLYELENIQIIFKVMQISGFFILLTDEFPKCFFVPV